MSKINLQKYNVYPSFRPGQEKAITQMLKSWESGNKIINLNAPTAAGKTLDLYIFGKILEKEYFDQIYTCGPKLMMVAVAKYAASKEISCEVSLENTMACGIGACLCCVENTVDGHVCVCTEGPIFNTKKLKWLD